MPQAALVAAGLADDLIEGLALGAEAIDSGAALEPARRPRRVLRGGDRLMGRFQMRSLQPGPRRDSRDQAQLAFRRRPASGRGPAVIAPGLRRGRAAAVSVLVDQRFGGTWDDLRAARAGHFVPLIAKGFFSDRGPLRTAKEAGADAVLLLLRDLDDGRDEAADARGRRARARHAGRGARPGRARSGGSRSVPRSSASMPAT